ncbi:condensation domain-containing protein [Streptomyces erythrochromogenes]|uniref:condensation domain-containing protein n=1 Tax=Streptomyces erythrochromogenes TaxID=285574 RepID=UPI002257F45F|nr:condensation domain-containing protein [Streptomyces erythrochromogenes]MCX5589240.1 condensation domain-containing protein [Streptomyces erythrochromogenes]
MLSITSQYLARYRRLAGDRSDTLLPVTGAQRRFVLVRALDPTGRPDLVPMFFAFPSGTIDPERLHAAARRLAARHTALRSRPTVVRGTPVLSVAADPDVGVTRPAAPEPGESPADALRRALASWDAQGPSLRLFLVPDEEREEDVLAVVLDHAVCDGRSLARIVDELGAAYAEEAAGSLPAPGEAQAELDAYRDAVLGQLAAEEKAETPEAAAYWADRLRTLHTHAPPPRPARVPRGANPSGAAQARLAAHDGGVSFPGLLDACRSAARELYGPDRAVPLGYPWGGRPAGAEPVVGCFLNTLVFPVDTGQGPGQGPGPGSEATADAWWDDLDRADVPFDAVVAAVRSAGSGWTGGLDGLLTVDDDTRRPPLVLDGVEGREVHVDGRPVRGPFAVSVTQGAEIRLRMVWDRAVLDDETAHRAFDALTQALRPSDHAVQ